MKRILPLLVAIFIIIVIAIAGCTSSGTDDGNVAVVETPTPATTSQTTSEPTAAQTTSQTSGSDTLRIGAFNVQVFGVSKASEPEVMDVLADVIRTYDIIGIQEIRDKSQTAFPELVDLVNSDGSAYEYVVSERLGRTSSKEQYAYIYNTETAVLKSDPYTYPEPTGTDPFHREPYIASFGSIIGDFDATLITIHTDPDEATSEINSLDDVVDYAVSHSPYDKDVIVMGDFNADGSYFDEDGGSTLNSEEYTWVIGNDMDTTTKSTDYTYDRIVFTSSVGPYYTSESGVFRFDTEYGLTQDETEDVSDHYPVYAIFTNGDSNVAYNTPVRTAVPTFIPKAKTIAPTTTSTPVPTITPTKTVSSGSSIYVSGISLSDEWVKITNDGATVNLQGWYIQDDDAKHTYTFSSFTLGSGETVTLHSGKGTDTSDELYWGGSNVWNNDGDTAYLYDDSGKLVSQK